MNKKERFKGVIIGIAFTLLFMIPFFAFAAPKYKQISVNMGGIKIVVDGEEIIPRDVNGKVVEPLIYEGTTYLPVRAITQAITKGMKPIEWDGKNWTIYIGEKSPTGKRVRFDELKPIVGESLIKTNTEFEVRQNKYTPFNDFCGADLRSYIYLLKGKYDKLTGYLAIDDSGLEGKCVLKVYAKDYISDDFKLIYTSKTIEALKEPIYVEVPLTAVDQMYFELEYISGGGLPHFFNIELVETDK